MLIRLAFKKGSITFSASNPPPVTAPILIGSGNTKLAVDGSGELLSLAAHVKLADASRREILEKPNMSLPDTVNRLNLILELVGRLENPPGKVLVFAVNAYDLCRFDRHPRNNDVEAIQASNDFVCGLMGIVNDPLKTKQKRFELVNRLLHSAGLYDCYRPMMKQPREPVAIDRLSLIEEVNKWHKRLKKEVFWENALALPFKWLPSGKPQSVSAALRQH